MAKNVLVDAGFLVALVNRRDFHHGWAKAQAERLPPAWSTCESALSEAFHLLGERGGPALSAMLRRRAVLIAFELEHHIDAVLTMLKKYSDVPMSLADGCLVRMTEALDDPVILTTDTDFRIYRRHSRQAVPCVLPN